ncbi:MAG: DUF5633 domain-containing protein [Anaerococcus vaginalis]|uniref:DUF5633 domain-containing protein n=1 Tax=Anaerococcus TaxID=165779 RepID=UPI0008A3C577|nr:MULTISPECIES: DUF5633 domain-containing protein [Anaerococcus]MDU5085835.1 DUF5633 domain-containing protein [Anaerococcus vaginalis]OFL17678.1 hypothetical protein HMPREF2782_05480 [Anaerococcus sp. HMSC068A02]
MKKKNVLALALAAGLVFGGTAYADGEGEPAPDPSTFSAFSNTADNGIGDQGFDGEDNLDNTDQTPPTGTGSQTTPDPKPEKPKAENNENGYSSEAAADAAGKAAAAASKKYYEVYLQYGNYHYRLLNAPSNEQKIKDDIYKQQPKALAESKFNPDQGYATFEEAQKAAEAIVAKSEINKGYNITKGKDGKYYIELTVDAKKTKDLDRKEIKPAAKPAVKANNNNVQTGVAGLTGVVATLAAASTALFKSKRK